MSENVKAQRLPARITGRMFFAGAAAILILGPLVSKDIVVISCLNNFKQAVEPYVVAFEEGRAVFDPAGFRLAENYYRLLADFAPANALAFGSLGAVEFYLKDYEKAVSRYERALRLEPKMYTFYWDLGMMCFSRKEFKHGRFFWEDALSFLDKTIPSLESLVPTPAEGGKERLRQTAERLIVRAKRDEAEAFAKLAQCRYYLRDYAGMQAAARQGLKKYPLSEDILLQAGLAEVMLGDTGAAVHYFTKIIVLNADNVDAYVYRSLCMARLGEETKQRRDVLKAAWLERQGFTRKDPGAEPVRLHFNTEFMNLAAFVNNELQGKP